MTPKHPRLGVLLVLRWTARILGTALLLLIAAFAVGEGVPNPLAQPLTVNLLFAAMLTMMIGLAAAWKWERIGGLLILGGFTFFAVVKGKRFLCAKCRKRSPKPVKTPAPWYCPTCLKEIEAATPEILAGNRPCRDSE